MLEIEASPGYDAVVASKILRKLNTVERSRFQIPFSRDPNPFINGRMFS